MSGFSIDLAADRIVEPRTRTYFEEVRRSFANECYRSCLVMLWTVVVCDLLYKLQWLRDYSGDTAAAGLLAEIEKKQLANPSSPDWEVFLLDEVAKRTKMLEATDYVQLRHLQSLRHLSAHPVLTAADLLFHPTKEIARGQIRVALEALLLKPALFSKRIIEALIEDIAINKALLIFRDKLSAFLEVRYLRNMPRQIERELFKTLWKFCFRLKNADTDANIKINSETLAFIYSRDKPGIRDLIQEEQAYFSNIGSEVDLLDNVIDFLAGNGELYAFLDTAAKILIEGRVKADPDNRIKASFIFPDMTSHLESLQGVDPIELAKMKDGTWQHLLEAADGEGLLNLALELVIKIYGSSKTFDAADVRFARFVGPSLAKFTSEKMSNLLAAIEANSQTYGRSRSKFEHSRVKTAAEALGIETAVYPSFLESCT